MNSETEKTDTYRLFSVKVPLSKDPGKDIITNHPELLKSLTKFLSKVTKGITINESNVEVVRKSFDGRWKRDKANEPSFVYTLDIKIPSKIKIKNVSGKIEKLVKISGSSSNRTYADNKKKKKKVVIVGFGPAGLFAAHTLSMHGRECEIIVIERGQPVESRGRDIGALFHRKILNEESNLCFGEGGAGTWSDGKLTTRIGKNSEDVRYILNTLVTFGAPERILIDGKPHLGTDRLVRILSSARESLKKDGVKFLFGTKVDDIILNSQGKATGVTLSCGQDITDCDAIILAVGHSARNVYEALEKHHVEMTPKAIACGFRIEHPQELINEIQYGPVFGKLPDRGKGPVPVADYRLVTQVPSENRACYSFCMCPGGQVVPTSVNSEELSVNGMSFSKRQSKWANSGLVVTIKSEDYIQFLADEDAMPSSKLKESPLIGIEWQRHIERKASVLGGGNLVAPVQRITDFMKDHYDVEDPRILPTSSYRLGVKNAPCHTIYPLTVTNSLKDALQVFDKKLPGLICDEGLLHGVESRTSAPVQITRDSETLESVSTPHLYPAGEGAGYAGGIVSAAVDGLKIAYSILDS